MSKEEIEQLLRSQIGRQFWLDVLKLLVARAKAAHKITNIICKGYRPRRVGIVRGTIRFNAYEDGVEKLGGEYAAQNLLQQYLPGTELQVFQPFQLMGSVLVGVAMHSERGKLPPPNKSRKHAVQLNMFATLHLDLPVTTPEKILFVLVLVERDRENPGAVASVDIAVIDPSYDHFIYYEKLETFVAGYEVSAPAPAAKPLDIKLKHPPKEFESPAVKFDSVGEGKDDKKRDKKS
jgi:hypothetical protein